MSRKNRRAWRATPAGVAVALVAWACCPSLAFAQAQSAPVIGVDEVDFARLGLMRGEIVRVHVDPTPGLPVELQVPIAGDVHTMKLAPHSLRAPGYRLLEARAGGALIEVDPGPVNTLRGTLEKAPGSIVAGGMMGDGLWAKILLPNGESYWIEPIASRIPGAAADQYVVYNTNDVLQSGHRCDVDEHTHRVGPRQDAPFTPRGATRFTAQVAVEADFEYYGLYGSTGQVQSRIALVYNVMNIQYERDTDIVHTIVSTIVNTAEPDPYNAGGTGDMLTEMRNFWNANRSGIGRDVAHLFTGKPTGGVIGTAFLGVVCSSLSSGFGYGVSQTDFNNFNLSSAADLIAHETGHNWNACHCPCSNPNFTMNPFITSVGRFGTVADECSTSSVAAIVAHRNSRGCLSTSTDSGVPNDLCGSATVIGPGTIGFSNVTATTDGPSSCGSIGADIWYVYTAPHNGTVTVSTCGTHDSTAFDTVVAAYTGSCGALTLVQCNDDNTGQCGTLDQGTRRDGWIQFPVTRGTNYFIQVGGFGGATGSGLLNLNITACSPPANDLCANAITITDGAYPFSTVCASTDGFIDNASGCSAFSYQQTASDIWYRYVAPCTGSATASICGLDRTYDTRLAVYAGGCPSAVFQAIACNDDSCGTGSNLTWNMAVGTTYLIRVGGFFGAQGTGTLVVARNQQSNEVCANAVALTAPGGASGSTLCATNDGSASCAASDTSPDVWYSLTAPRNGFFYADTETSGTITSNYDTALSIHSGCPGTIANQVACDDDSGAGLLSRVTWYQTAGTTNLIRVNGFNGRTGTYSLNVGPLPHDNCANAILVSTGTYFDTLAGASNEPANSTGACGASATNPDAWYRFFAPANGTLTVTTCGTHDAAGRDTGMDTVLGLYSACGAAPLACNDDSATCGSLDVGIFRDSNLSRVMTAGTSVLIRVSKFSTVAAGAYRLNIDFATNCHGTCVTDFDDGSGTGTPDGGVTIDDLLYYLGLFQDGRLCADVDDGSGTGTTDGGVTIDDLLYFLFRFDAGC